jgi:hypothetical protein
MYLLGLTAENLWGETDVLDPMDFVLIHIKISSLAVSAITEFSWSINTNEIEGSVFSYDTVEHCTLWHQNVMIIFVQQNEKQKQGYSNSVHWFWSWVEFHCVPHVISYYINPSVWLFKYKMLSCGMVVFFKCLGIWAFYAYIYIKPAFCCTCIVRQTAYWRLTTGAYYIRQTTLRG